MTTSSLYTFTNKIWHIYPNNPAAEKKLACMLSISPILSRILVNRGINEFEEARQFLDHRTEDIHDPYMLDGVAPAVDMIKHAISQRDKIMIHGDYDVDGITATALLVRVLKVLGADVCWYVPHRQKEGYDLSESGVEEARRKGVRLIITVDCGVSAVDAITKARQSDIDVIVTDHHEMGSDVASANIIINPHKPGCTYPFKELAGVGVAFKLGEALVREFGYDPMVYRQRFSDLAAIGTMADIVPLLGENRTIVKSGLEEIPRSGKKGIRALVCAAGLTDSKLTSHMLTFGLCPRLNAAGRIDDAAVALRLLLTTDEAEANKLACTIEIHNKERQSEQQRILKEVLECIEENNLHETCKVMVLHSQGWHPGVVGIVASKITERFNKPSILVALDESGEAGVGSARSIAGFDIFQALEQCSQHLVRFGGHPRAAGLSIETHSIGDFSEDINRIADEILSDSDLLPQIEVDTAIEPDAVTMELASELQLLEPYGFRNRQPVFLSEGVQVLQKNIIGSNGAHLKFKLGRQSGIPLECIAFGWGEHSEAFRLGSMIDLCYNIQINRFNGQENVQAVLRDARPSNA